MLHGGSIKIVAIVFGAFIVFLCGVAFGLLIAAWARNPTRGTDPGPEAAPGPEPEPDPKVCRSYLVGNCPRDFFTNTKNELGPCPKVQNEALKTEYQEVNAEQKRRWLLRMACQVP
ncbi:splicing factor [Epicoccum nigrum]|nr:splicing factor [Epicoccum nigrum]